MNKLDRNRMCYYEVGIPQTTPARVQMELNFRAKYKGTFSHRVDQRYFFQFPTRHQRDFFLKTLEQKCIEAGFIIERVELPIA